MNELADLVAQRERHARRHQAKLENQARQHNKEQEMLYTRIAALEMEFVDCRRPPPKKKESEMQMMHSHIQNECGECNTRISSQQVSPLPSTSSYQPQQGQESQGRKHRHGKTTDATGGKL